MNRLESSWVTFQAVNGDRRNQAWLRVHSKDEKRLVNTGPTFVAYVEAAKTLEAAALADPQKLEDNRGVPTGQVPMWFERKFEFSFPLEQYPNLCVRLRGTPARLEEMLGAVAHDILVRKPGDKWSAQEHAGHLLDLESLWMARAGDYLTGRSELTVADLSNRKTHEGGYNSRPLKDILGEFRQERQRLLDRVVGSSRVDLQACKLEYSIVSPK